MRGIGRAKYVFLAMVTVGLLAGCEMPSGSSKHLLSDSGHKNTPAEEAEHRDEYVSSHSKTAMRWLLANRITSGMHYDDVCHILGEDGERQQNSQWLKNKGTVYRVDDVAYKFGPDAEGNAVYLVFRENRLVNFVPSQFEDSGPPPRKHPPAYADTRSD